jgi:hypothetical protein
MSVLSIKLSFVPVLSWSTNIKTINNTDCIVFRGPLDEYRARECCVRVGSYCAWFLKVPCSMYDLEIICLAWGLSLLCHENFRARISSGVFPVHRLQNVTQYNYTVLHSYHTILQSYIHTLHLYSSTVIPCTSTIIQSRSAVIYFYSWTL